MNVCITRARLNIKIALLGDKQILVVPILNKEYYLFLRMYYIMHKLVYLVLLLIAGSFIFVASADDPPQYDVVVFSVYDENIATFTNLTLSGPHYSVESADSYIDGLEGAFNFNWFIFSEALEIADFENLDYEVNGTPNLIISVVTSSINHTLEIDQLPVFITEDLGITRMVNMLEDAMDRTTGSLVNSAVWPVDLQLIVLESYPEQYAVSLVLQRGMDLLAYVFEENVTMFAGTELPEGNLTHDWFRHAIFGYSKTIFLPAGGSTQTLSFPTFSIFHSNFTQTDSVTVYPNDLTSEDLTILVIMQSGDYISLDVDTGEIQVRQSTITNGTAYVDLAIANFDVTEQNNGRNGSTVDPTDTENLAVPVLPIWFLTTLVSLPLIKKRK